MKKIMVSLLAISMIFASVACNVNGPDSSSGTSGGTGSGVENGGGSGNGGNEGETISVDLTNEKWLASFVYNYSRGNYGKSFAIGNHEEFKVGDKLDVKVKLEVSRDISSLTAGIFYLNDDGDLVFIGNQECEVEVKRNIKAGEEFVASFTYNVTKKNVPADNEKKQISIYFTLHLSPSVCNPSVSVMPVCCCSMLPLLQPFPSGADR